MRLFSVQSLRALWLTNSEQKIHHQDKEDTEIAQRNPGAGGEHMKFSACRPDLSS